ncbi:alpha/beta fold hydrolase [Streptomyces sp. NPDC005794]|uniref:alpha/beta fold hydrolase n=1 Tax=Streptomyces sp. NPDC005794 TaxID=3364733 RepID=UPI00369732C0
MRAIANSLQGLTSDTAYVSSYLFTVDDPVVLVGHSYAGAVIANVATSDPDVKALVYVAGFILAKARRYGRPHRPGPLPGGLRRRRRQGHGRRPSSPAARQHPSGLRCQY